MVEDSDVIDWLKERLETEGEKQSLRFKRVFEEYEKSISEEMRSEERSERLEGRSRNEPKVEPGTTPNISWANSWGGSWTKNHNHITPQIPAKEYALLIVAYCVEKPLKWKDITSGINAHWTRVNDSLKNLQGKRYIQKVTELDEEPKLYDITEEGREVLLKEKKLEKAVENDRMGETHKKMMLREARLYVINGYHVHPDFHMGDKIPDLIVTPIVHGMRYDEGHQFACEFEVSPPDHKERVIRHEKANRRKGWPTVWYAWRSRHENKLLGDLLSIGAKPISEYDMPIHRQFSDPDEVYVCSIGHGEASHSIEELMKNSRAMAVAKKQGKHIYGVQKGYIRTYDPKTQKKETIGRIEDYGQMVAKEDNPEEMDSIIEAIDRDLSSMETADKLVEAIKSDSGLRIGQEFIYAGNRKVCRKDKKVWDPKKARYLKASVMLGHMLSRKQKKENGGPEDWATAGLPGWGFGSPPTIKRPFFREVL